MRARVAVALRRLANQIDPKSTPLHVEVVYDAQMIREALLRLKRRNGGCDLGLS